MNASRTATLSASVEGQLAELAGTLARLADDLDGGFAVRSGEVASATDRVIAATNAIRFVSIVSAPA